MDFNFKVVDLLKLFQDVLDEGYDYCEVSLIPAENKAETSFLSVSGLENGGRGRVEWEELDCVSMAELIQRAWTKGDVMLWGKHTISEMKTEMLAEYQRTSEIE